MLWLGYVALAVPAKVLYDHFAAYGTSRWIFACVVLLFVAAVVLEMKAAGCTPANCTPVRNREAAQSVPKSGARALCAESKRVTWRVSYVLAFLVFTALNIVRVEPRGNLTIFVVTWTLAQGMFGLLAAHRLGIWCVD
jgi:hypothetical protein